MAVEGEGGEEEGGSQAFLPEEEVWVGQEEEEEYVGEEEEDSNRCVCVREREGYNY